MAKFRMVKIRKLDIQQFAIGFVAILAAGLAFFGTYAKFVSDYRCDQNFLQMCKSLGGNCSSVWESEASTLWGLPVTLAATAFYLVTLLLLIALRARRGWFHGVEMPFLVSSGYLTVTVTVFMATVSLLMLGERCPICIGLYAMSFIYWMLVNWMARLGPVQGFFVLVRWLVRAIRSGNRSLFKATLSAVSCGMLLWLAQAWLYTGSRGDSLPSDCRVLRTLPETTLIAGAERPTWIFAEFIDPACGYCRKQHAQFQGLLTDHPDTLQIRFYHYPRDRSCSPSPAFAQLVESFPASGFNYACMAARAIQCADHIAREQKRAGIGTRMLARVMALQDTREPYFALRKLVTAAREEGIETDPRASDDIFSQCVGGEVPHPAHAIIEAHIHYGLVDQIRATPQMFAIPVLDGEERMDCAIKYQGVKPTQVLEELLATKDVEGKYCHGSTR